jgi:hypothetical protein
MIGVEPLITPASSPVAGYNIVLLRAPKPMSDPESEVAYDNPN